MTDITELEGLILRIQRNWWIDCSGYTTCQICPVEGKDECPGKNDPTCPVNSLKRKMGY